MRKRFVRWLWFAGRFRSSEFVLLFTFSFITVRWTEILNNSTLDYQMTLTNFDNTITLIILETIMWKHIFLLYNLEKVEQLFASQKILRNLNIFLIISKDSTLFTLCNLIGNGYQLMRIFIKQLWGSSIYTQRHI